MSSLYLQNLIQNCFSSNCELYGTMVSFSFSILHVSISQGAFQCVSWSHSPVLLSLQVAKAFLEPKTSSKVKFVYADEINTKKITGDLFDMDRLEAVFGGKRCRFCHIREFAERITEDDKRMPSFWTRVSSPSAAPQPDLASTTLVRTFHQQ
ncbi:hypothetical protein NC651_013742 [Populus alba x Populus x berolinensis]|nr:hypothetical protein NC651_013742 [Populus alba x Populus x berolinensis]